MARKKAEDNAAEPEAPRFVVTITAPAGSRRRAGFAFGKEPVHLTEAELDKDKIELLKGDPQLVIRDYVEPEPEATTEA